MRQTGLFAKIAHWAIFKRSSLPLGEKERGSFSINNNIKRFRSSSGDYLTNPLSFQKYRKGLAIKTAYFIYFHTDSQISRLKNLCHFVSNVF
jgi:hypothetical protein